MKQKWKEQLKKGFAAPDPVKKEAFLRSVDSPKVGGFAFLLTQAGYIRKWVWGLSLLVLAIAFLGAKLLEKDMVWCISAFMPLLAMASVTETGRSEIYGMAEFERSTRFPLRSVVLARLCILGTADLLLICLLVPLASTHSGAAFLRTGVYILCPYLLTAYSSLWVLERIRNREGIYLCVGLSATVSAGDLFLYTNCLEIFADRNFMWWIAALAALGMGTWNQCCRMIKKTEELAWS